MNQGTFAFTTLLSAAVFSFVAPNLQAQSFYANLDGPTEGNASPGTGYATVDFNLATHTMHVTASFTGLTGTTTASHIHAATATAGTGTAGVATMLPYFTGMPLGVTSGSFENTFDMTLAASYNPNYITANGGTTASAEAALLTAAEQGKAYFNIHTSTFGGGEIRGFLTPVPEPSSVGLISAGALAAFSVFRKVTGKKVIG